MFNCDTQFILVRRTSTNLSVDLHTREAHQTMKDRGDNTYARAYGPTGVACGPLELYQSLTIVPAASLVLFFLSLYGTWCKINPSQHHY